jgi:Protein of unknown function (DUF2911)
MARPSTRLLARLALGAAAALSLAGTAAAQSGGITVPPSGGNQRAAVTQYIGLVKVGVDYSSPHVHSPSGEDRKGKIWGDLVPYGMANLGFGTCGDQCPWRGGANENTVFTTSHDLEVQGKTLPAGSYGLHFIPGKDEWTVIFSKNSTSWGSFFYDPKEDALRVTTKAEPSDYHEVLTYEFPERKTDTATLALKWENLQVPLVLKTDAVGVYVANMRKQLRSTPGFSWQGWNSAARYCLQNKTNLPEALTWAETGAQPGFTGDENFTTLSTLSALQAANGKTAEATKTMDKAIGLPGASALDLQTYGKQLLTEKKPDEAMKVFQLNAKRNSTVWFTHAGLARGYSAQGKKKEALAEAQLALKAAPDDQKKSVEGLIKDLEGAK